MSHKPQWFSVTLLFVSSVGNIRSLRPLCEERVVLFHARDEAATLDSARRFGESEAHSYKNSDGDAVEWKFLRIETIEALGVLPAEGGWEVASRYVRRSRGALRKQQGKK